MDPLAILAVLAAGLAAGTVNAVVGAGSLITFPTLLALGLPPVTANASNTVGLVAGGLSGTWGYRRELTGMGPRLRLLLPSTAVGALVGGVLLLVLPQSAFEAVVPGLLVVGAVLIGVQPALSRTLRKRKEARGRDAADAGRERRPRAVVPWPLLFLTALLGVYGGYFGAAQGVILIAVLGFGLPDGLQVLNGLKNACVTTANLVSGLLFVAVADLSWLAVLLIAVGSAVGGQLGAKLGRRLPSTLLRAVVVVLGLAVAARLALT